MSKKVDFINVKQGQFFRWKRHLYQKSNITDVQKIRGKNAGKIYYPEVDDQVTIVKVKILEK